MSAESDRRKTTTDINPERRLEDVKKAAAEALKRFDRECADLCDTFRAVHSTSQRRMS